MLTAPKPAISGRRLLRILWRLGRVYWGSPDAKAGVLLLAVAIALELGTVYANVRLASAERDVLDALEQRQAVAFFADTGIFLAAMVAFTLVSTYRVYMRQALEIRWRSGLTDHYLERWIGRQAYSQARLHGDEVDNPDQRIAEDVRDYVASALGLSLSMLSAATSELDEAMERRVYDLFAARLPFATLISVAHRSAVEAYHAKRWVLSPRDHGPAVLEPA
jgi:ABC-type uncharacterized transport system fused permease/ATPase subunit